ncbi:DNA internalization-related competence protein ComEC/Rec2 [Piscinibacter sp.]|uniref:DNA internalization-related competence protein ComEC/Rec2 n=1 Tax=Piscinibacter sp. TaxID=1903157 RepID=UPI0039E60A61
MGGRPAAQAAGAPRWFAALLALPLGAGAQLQQRALDAPACYAALCALGALLALAGWRWRRLAGASLIGVIGLIGLALIGFGSTGWRAGQRLAEHLPAALEGRDVQLVGIVASLPQPGPNGVRFRFEVERASVDGAALALPRLIALGWYADSRDDAALSPAQRELRAGQRRRFEVRLRRPHGSLNPHGFDYELMLFEQGVRATGYVRGVPPPPIEEGAGYPVQRLRQRARDAIFARVADARAAGVLAALAVGDQGAIEREDWELFRSTGLAHLMAISGLHITMFAWLAARLIGALWRRSPRAMLAVPAPQAARWGGLLVAAAYAVFAGWAVPAQRTVWMLATVVLLRGIGVRWPWPLVLALAALVVTLVDPWALLQPGFWLSFAAVALLMASEPGEASGAATWRQRLVAALHGGVRTQLVATLGLAPLTLLFFQQVSLVGFFANLLAIPLVTLLVTPLALLGSLAPPLWTLAAWLLQPLTTWLQWLAGLPVAVWFVPAAPAWASAAALLGGALLVLPLPWRTRLLAAPLLLPLLLTPPERPPPGHYELLAVDVGQGTAVLVRTRHHLLVYDAGPQYSRESDAGARVLLPLLRARGERQVDRLVLSHRDTDHVGGARALLSALPVRSTSSSLPPDHPLLALAPRHATCAAGQTWVWDGVRFEFLHPREGEADPAARPNTVSCVLRVAAAGAPVTLLAGDIEREQELRLAGRHGEALRAGVLVVPHHGSRTSSTPLFLDAVRPQVAVVQAGYRNRFGHPAAEVVERYRALGSTLVASPACGAWAWRSDQGGPGRCQRDAARRYWHLSLDGEPVDG